MKMYSSDMFALCQFLSVNLTLRTNVDSSIKIGKSPLVVPFCSVLAVSYSHDVIVDCHIKEMKNSNGLHSDRNGLSFGSVQR